MNAYYDGLNIKLFEAIPRNSKNILELGCANGKLGELFKKINPHTIWTGIDINKNAIAEASKKIDNAYNIDIESEDLQKIGKGFDAIVIGDLLEHLKNPERILSDLLLYFICIVIKIYTFIFYIFKQF
jgi:2-polyprenyl-3-methyl-5-hydroxy-6-metoxy-1,4-benzoquinol methylase